MKLSDEALATPLVQRAIADLSVLGSISRGGVVSITTEYLGDRPTGVITATVRQTETDEPRTFFFAHGEEMPSLEAARAAVALVRR